MGEKEIANSQENKHWEIDIWKALFGRITIIFLIMQFVFLYIIYGDAEAKEKFWLSLIIFVPVYVVSFISYIKAKRHEQKRLRNEK